MDKPGQSVKLNRTFVETMIMRGWPRLLLPIEGGIDVTVLLI